MKENDSNNKLVINQTLHGYKDGHHLLAASIKLTKKVKKQLLILSDLSGPMFVSGFKKYLTGYPINGEDLYAIAKTWYADEMERAGCVWTHTLLIKCEDLENIDDLNILLKCYKRPIDLNNKESYKKPIVLDRSLKSLLDDFPPTNQIFYPILKNIITYLYDLKNPVPILVPSENSSKYENIVLNIWSQQWYSLRKTFKFCTGSISNRKYNNKSFDLQIVPTKNIRQIKRDTEYAKIIHDENAETLNSEDHTWIDIAVEDIYTSHSQDFGKFLKYAGKDLPANRRLYFYLADIYAFTNCIESEDKSLQQLLEKIFGYFPDPSTGKYVKEKAVGDNPEGGRLIKTLSENFLLKELSFTKYSNMFDLKQLNIRSRAIRAWKNNKQSIKELLIRLVRTDVNPIGEEILKGIAEIISEDQLLELTIDHPEFLYTFIMHNPSIANYPALWLASHINKLELIDHLSNVSKIFDNEKNRITKSILSSGNLNLIDSLYKIWGDSILEPILLWIDSSDSINLDSIKPGLLGVIKDCPKKSLEWLSYQENFDLKTAVIIAGELNPHGELVKEYGTKIWLKTLELVKNNTPEGVKKRFAKFLLPFGLNNPDDGAYELVVFSFPIIHRALEKSQLDYDSWKKIDWMLPRLPWYWSWDKCERLKRGLIRFFKKYNWPLDDLSNFYDDKNLLS